MLDYLPSEIICKIFLNLTVKEIFKLYRINSTFNNECTKELLWKFKVKMDYGIKKKYGKTWKATARLLSKSNMINLDKKHACGKTYAQILNIALMKGIDSYKYIQMFVGIDILLSMFLNKKEIWTRELRVITAAIYIYRDSYPFLLSIDPSIPEIPSNLHFIIPQLLDFTPYIIEFSMYSEECLYLYIKGEFIQWTGFQDIYDKISSEEVKPDRTILNRIEDVEDIKDECHNLFQKFKVDEILALCEVNESIRHICETELLWKIKVELDYGIAKKYPNDSTWRKTAEMLFKIGMINLNDKWINGET